MCVHVFFFVIIILIFFIYLFFVFTNLLIYLFIHFSKICSKFQIDFTQALALSAQENEKNNLLIISKIQKKHKKMEEEWRLVLGDFGSNNSREKIKQEKIIFELTNSMSDQKKNFEKFKEEIKVYNARENKDRIKVKIKVEMLCIFTTVKFFILVASLLFFILVSFAPSL